jgi:Kef-type K+ transport system membrane component KefB
VLQIVAGAVVGPQVLGGAHDDTPVRVLSVVGLAFLLFLSGLEIDFDRLRGQVLRLTSIGFALSFALAVVMGLILGAAGLVRSPLLIAVILAATSLGVILPALQDSGQLDTPFGQVVVAGASIAEVVPVVLLSLLFSEDGSGVWSQLTLLAVFAAFVAVAGLLIFGFERLRWLSRTLLALQDTTAEIRIRGAVALLMVFAAIASVFGLEAILGAFLAGATLKLLDHDRGMTHSQFRVKLQAVGFGAFVPFFFVSTGLALDLHSLARPGTLVRVPVFLAMLFIARAAPALLYRPLAARPAQVFAAGLLQATSISIPIVAGTIGVDLGLIRPENYAALVTAGLVSVIVFPLLALPRLGATGPRTAAVTQPSAQSAD